MQSNVQSSDIYIVSAQVGQSLTYPVNIGSS
jgi:hypothetical protein